MSSTTLETRTSLALLFYYSVVIFLISKKAKQSKWLHPQELLSNRSSAMLDNGASILHLRCMNIVCVCMCVYARACTCVYTVCHIHTHTVFLGHQGWCMNDFVLIGLYIDAIYLFSPYTVACLLRQDWWAERCHISECRRKYDANKIFVLAWKVTSKACPKINIEEPVKRLPLTGRGSWRPLQIPELLLLVEGSLQLSSITLLVSTCPTGFVINFGGNLRHIIDYLAAKKINLFWAWRKRKGGQLNFFKDSCFSPNSVYHWG